MGKIFGVVIWYHPSKDVIGNIVSYLPLVDELLVIDNTETIGDFDPGSLGSKVRYFSDGVNKGIAARLNEAVAYARTNGAHWLLTMDQDSSFEPDSLSAYFHCFSHFLNKKAVAMFGVEHEVPAGSFNCNTQDTAMLITSGSLVNLEVLTEIGGFDEQLFIDEVDFEYCLRAQAAQYRVVKFTNVYLQHTLGQTSVHRSVKGLGHTTRTLHSPLRLYYMVRNYLYVSRRYSLSPGVKRYKRVDLLHRIKNNLLYGKNKTALLRYIFLAYRHYKSGRMGRL